MDEFTPEEIEELQERLRAAHEAREHGRVLRCGCTKYQGKVYLIKWGCFRHNRRMWWDKEKKRVRLPPL